MFDDIAKNKYEFVHPNRSAAMLKRSHRTEEKSVLNKVSGLWKQPRPQEEEEKEKEKEEVLFSNHKFLSSGAKNTSYCDV